MATVRVNAGEDAGPLELWRQGTGHGGINSLPLPDRVSGGIRKLHPRLIRIFIQEFFFIYPEHGRFDWSRLDPYMDAVAKTGAKVVAAITIKPKPLFRSIDAKTWKPNDVGEWQRVVAALVRRYSVDRPIVTYWEIGNEPDIGESGGCPYLISDPDQYAEFYQMTTQPILNVFPQAHVGGPAVANADSDYLPRFINLCLQKKLHVDFVSWHVYSNDPAHHAAEVEKFRKLLEPFGEHRPEMLVTEWNKNFDRVSVEEMAFDPRRAAAAAATALAMNDAGVDFSFYYHAWDQVCFLEEFKPFFSDPQIMYRHWNETPHRFGLFGVDQEVRPQYFVFQMLNRVGSRRVRAQSDAADLRVLAGTDNGMASAILVNYATNASQDRIASVHFAGLRPGPRSLIVYRIDRTRSWSDDKLELVPAETRDTDVQEEFFCQVACPADSVGLIVLKPTGHR